MDAHLPRFNQMSYQQQHYAINSRNNTNNFSSNKNHYSNRQLDQSVSSTLIRHQNQSQNQNHGQAQLQAKQQRALNTLQSSSGSENEEQQQLSSNISSSTTSKTVSSQQAMLSHSNNKTSPQQLQQQQLLHQQQQQRRQQQPVQQQHHRQQALQAHTLTGPSGGPKANQANYGHMKSASQQQHSTSSADNMTTSSSSDHTIDDLHHLAGPSAGYHHNHHHHNHHARLAGSSGRYAGLATGDKGLEQSQSGSRFLLGVLFTLAELLLFTTILLWLYWSYQHDDGLAWQNDRKQQFNTHAALMLLGFIFLNGQAMLIYRSFQCCNRIYTKILHTILFVLATSAISLGLILGYTAQDNVGANNKQIMHFYSLHAWIGLSTVGLFVFQFVFGFVSFLILLCCENATNNFRAALLPIHKTFGLIIFSLAIATCLTGLLQTARSRLSSKLNKIDYHELAEPGIVINLIGVCLICLAILMPYIIRNLDIKRPSRVESERHLKLSQLDMRI